MYVSFDFDECCVKKKSQSEGQGLSQQMALFISGGKMYTCFKYSKMTLAWKIRKRSVGEGKFHPRALSDSLAKQCI